jgi:hypothetical protein
MGRGAVGPLLAADEVGVGAADARELEGEALQGGGAGKQPSERGLNQVTRRKLDAGTPPPASDRLQALPHTRL